MTTLERQLCNALRQHLAGNPVAVPEAGRLAWGWFVDLNQTRSGGMGPAPITYGEIEAYARLYRWPLEPRHVDIIRAMDRVWLGHMQHRNDGSHVFAPGPAQDLTPNAFDAVFA